MLTETETKNDTTVEASKEQAETMQWLYPRGPDSLYLEAININHYKESKGLPLEKRFPFAVLTSFSPPSEGLLKEMTAAINRIRKIAHAQGFTSLLAFVSEGKPGDADVKEILKAQRIPYIVVTQAPPIKTDEKIRLDVVRYLVMNAKYVYLSFDGDDDEIMYTVGECLTNARPFKISQDTPTKPRHVFVDAMMRGMKKQAQEMKAAAEAAGESTENQPLQFDKDAKSGVEALEFRQ